MKGAISLVQAVLIIVILLALGLIISTFIRGIPLAPFGGCGHESQKCCGNEFSPLGFCLDPGTQCIEYDNEKLCLKPATELSIDKEALVWSDANYGEFISNYPTNNFYMTTQGIGKESLDHLNENCWVEGQDAQFGGCNNCSLTSNINSLMRQNLEGEPPNFIKECSDCDQCNASEKTCTFCIRCKSFTDTAIFYGGYFKTFAIYENLTNCANCSECTVDEYGFGSCNNCTFCESGDVAQKDEYKVTSSSCHFCSRYDGSKYYNCYFCDYLEDKSVATPTDDYYACDVCEKVESGTLKCSDNSSYLLCEDMKAALGNNMSTPVPLAENIPSKSGSLEIAPGERSPLRLILYNNILPKCKGQSIYSDLSFGFRKRAGTFNGATHDLDISTSLSPTLERATNYWSCGVTDQPDSLVYRIAPGAGVSGEFFSSVYDNHFYNIYYYAPNNTITICRQPALTTYEDDAILDIPLRIMKDINLLKLGGDFHIIEKKDERGLTYIHTNYPPIEVKLNYGTRKIDLFNAIITGFNIWRVAYSDPFYLNVTYNRILGVKCTNETSCKNIDLSGELSVESYQKSNVLLWSYKEFDPMPSADLADGDCVLKQQITGENEFTHSDYLCKKHIGFIGFDPSSEKNMYRYILYNHSEVSGSGSEEYYPNDTTLYIKVNFLVVWKNETSPQNSGGSTSKLPEKAVEFIPIVGVSENKDFIERFGQDLYVVWSYHDINGEKSFDVFNFTPLGINAVIEDHGEGRTCALCPYTTCNESHIEQANSLCRCALGSDSANATGCMYKATQQNPCGDTVNIWGAVITPTCGVTQSDVKDQKCYLLAVYCSG